MRRSGILFPVDVLSLREAAALLASLEDIEASHGPNLLCWGAQFFAKNARAPRCVSWHQDGTYWGLSSPDMITAWVALTPSQPDNGCMRVIPGTYRAQVPNADTFADPNLWSRCQEIVVEVDQTKAIDVAGGRVRLPHAALCRSAAPARGNRARHQFRHADDLRGLSVRLLPRLGTHSTADGRPAGHAHQGSHEWIAQRVTAWEQQDFRAIDWLYQSWAYDAHDVGTTPGYGGNTAAALAAIRADTLIMAPPLDLYNPAQAARDCALDIHRARFVEIDSGWGHQSASAADSDGAAQLNAQIAAFLAQG